MFGLKIIWLESSHNPEWQLKRLSEAIWTSYLDGRHKNAAWLLSTIQNDGNNVRILSFFGGEFHKESLRFRG